MGEYRYRKSRAVYLKTAGGREVSEGTAEFPFFRPFFVE
jgi:hypothetical protein